MAAIQTPEQRTYLALYRKAVSEGEFQVYLSSLKAAHSMRIAIYRAAKPYRDGKRIDALITQAIEGYVIRVWEDDDTGKGVLAFTARESLKELESIIEQTGLTAEDINSQPLGLELSTEIERMQVPAIGTKLFAELMTKVDKEEIEPDQPHSKTPFYER